MGLNELGERHTPARIDVTAVTARTQRPDTRLLRFLDSRLSHAGHEVPQMPQRRLCVDSVRPDRTPDKGVGGHSIGGRGVRGLDSLAYAAETHIKTREELSLVEQSSLRPPGGVVPPHPSLSLFGVPGDVS
jgi:hypothetical protein